MKTAAGSRIRRPLICADAGCLKYCRSCEAAPRLSALPSSSLGLLTQAGKLEEIFMISMKLKSALIGAAAVI
jgi:hypothetical protein